MCYALYVPDTPLLLLRSSPLMMMMYDSMKFFEQLHLQYMEMKCILVDSQDTPSNIAWYLIGALPMCGCSAVCEI
jgi:hypothetical protein